MIGQMAIATALSGFKDLGRSVTPTFFFAETDFIHNYLHIIQKRTKNQCGKFKKFKISVHIESCHLAAARPVKLWSLNTNLFFKEPRQLTKFT